MTPAIAQYFQDKMDMLDKYLGDVQVLNCDCELERIAGDQKTGKVYRSEVNLQVPGALLRVEKIAADAYKSIDKVKDHLVVVIKKYKEKKKN